MKRNQDIIDALNRQTEESEPLLPFMAVVYFILWLGLISYMLKDSIKPEHQPMRVEKTNRR